jgi:hypothetical protein
MSRELLTANRIAWGCWRSVEMQAFDSMVRRGEKGGSRLLEDRIEQLGDQKPHTDTLRV